MNISFLTPVYRDNRLPGNRFLVPLALELKNFRHDVIVNDCNENIDVIISMTVNIMDRTLTFHNKYPKIPVICYNWDIYEWVWKDERGKDYDYKKYGELLKECIEVWCPSQCTVDRLKEWFNLDNGRVLKTCSLYYDKKPIDGRFVYNPLRAIPDRNYGLFEKACNELNIPYKTRGNTYLPWDEYTENVAQCSFMVSPYYEASTGGLALIEGTYLGKPCLASDSKYCGVRDYMGDRAWYFKHDSYEDLKAKIKEMWENTPKLNIQECQEWVKENYPHYRMAKDMNDRLLKLI